ncbi:MAG: FHA domain-containing protein [Gemmataceae bacterium]
MPAVTFQVLEGIDKGRIFRAMPTPVTIGREEGNVLRLNDERVSRFHAKIQFDNNEVIITDLESTNGTRVNGNVVQIRRLQAGDRIGVGRSLLVYGSEAEIRARMETQLGTRPLNAPSGGTLMNPGTVPHPSVIGTFEELEMEVHPTHDVTVEQGNLYVAGRQLPPLPQKLGPSNAARLAETLEFLHRHLIAATENIRTNEDATQVTLAFNDWQRVLGVQMLLARYIRAVAEPDSLDG